MATSLTAVTLSQNGSFDDRDGHRARVAERRHERGVLARATGHDDHHVVGRRGHVDPGVGWLVPETPGVDDGEAREVLGAERRQRHTGAFEECALEVT